MQNNIFEIEKIVNFNDDAEIFIGCSSFEERCLGTIKKFSPEYHYLKSFIFIYDKPDPKREEHTRIILEILSKKGPYQLIPSSETDPLLSIKFLIQELKTILTVQIGRAHV